LDSAGLSARLYVELWNGHWVVKLTDLLAGPLQRSSCHPFYQEGGQAVHQVLDDGFVFGVLKKNLAIFRFDIPRDLGLCGYDRYVAYNKS